MDRTRIFRNDGTQMFVDEPAQLDYIDPGIVLLYADTAQQIVCSYFEGRLGQPIQATIERKFEQRINVTALSNSVRTIDVPNWSVSEAPRDDPSSPRWALDGLDEDPLVVGDLQLTVIRRLVGTDPVAGRDDGQLRGSTGPSHRVSSDTDSGRFAILSLPLRVGSHESDQNPTGEGLDFAVRNPYDGARFFKYLVAELSQQDITIAVSKSGRVDALRGTDIVIHINPSELKSTEQVVPIDETADLVDAEKVRLKRRQFSQRIGGSITDLRNAYTRAVDELEEMSNNETKELPDGVEEAILRDELNDWIGGETDLAIVNRRREWYRRAGFIATGAVFGAGVGIVVSDSVTRLGHSLHEWSQTIPQLSVHKIHDGVVEQIHWVDFQLSGLLVVVSFLAAVGALTLRHRYNRTNGTPFQRRGARSDLVGIGLTVVISISVFSLLAALILYIIGS